MKVQAQHIQAGDIVGSGEKVILVIVNSTQWPSSKVLVVLEKIDGMRSGWQRNCYWGKYTMINIKRNVDKETESV